MRRSMTVLAAGATLATVLAWLPADVWAQGCAMCKASIGQGNDPLSRGFNLSILLIIGVTYGLLGTVGGWLGYTYWRAASRRPVAKVLPFGTPGKEGAQ